MGPSRTITGNNYLWKHNTWCSIMCQAHKARSLRTCSSSGPPSSIFSSSCCCSFSQSCPTLCSPTDCSTPGLPVLCHLLKFAQVHIHCIGDAIQPSYPLMPSSPSALNLSQDQGLFQLISYSHQVTKILELQLQHQSFQWVYRVDFP